jgi:hypothetical protein
MNQAAELFSKTITVLKLCKARINKKIVKEAVK